MIVPIVLLAALAAVVVYLLLYFGNWRTFPWYVQATCFAAWFFPFSIILILPLDLGSNLYRKCLDEKNEADCQEPFAYVPESFLWVFWQIAWVRSGDFGSLRKFLNAVKDNLIYYGVVGTIGLAFLAYMIVAVKFEKDDLLALLMAGANAWGLLLCTMMLGFGTVAIPRGLWRSANTAQCLKDLELKAPKAKEALMDSEAQIYELAREVAWASKKVEIDDPMRKFVDVLLEKCPLALDERAIDDGEEQSLPTYDKLRQIHSRLKYYTKVNERHQAEFRFLVQRAWLLNDILDNEANRERVLCVVCAVASLALVWSESTFQISSVPLSVPALLLKTSNITYGFIEVVSISFILYMCTCAYSTLFKIKIFDYYVIVPEHHTDEPSLLFVGAYLCRLTFPLCYNFLNMASDDEDSIFVKYQGKFIDLAPLLGEGFNTWVPELVLIFSIITLLNLFERIVSWLGIRKFFFDERRSELADVEEGRKIILQARSVEERRAARGFAGPSSYGLNEMTPNRSQRKAVPRATNTKELLAKYKTAATGNAAMSSALAGPSSSSAAAGQSESTRPNQASSSSSASEPATTFSISFPFGRKGGKSPATSGSATPTGGAGRYQKLVDANDSGSAAEPDSRSGSGGRRFGTSPRGPSMQAPPSHSQAAATGKSTGRTDLLAAPLPKGSASPSPTSSRVFGARAAAADTVVNVGAAPAVLPGPTAAGSSSGSASAKGGRRNIFDDI
ncbi:LMBR1 domain-containing protein 2 [Cladochytrium tenue]|nr:LMBR1 domain-containing protein 2 [Cladochytrium tenue]